MRPRQVSSSSLNLESLETREVPAALIADNFDTTSPYYAPAGWQQWSSNGSQYYGVHRSAPLSGPQMLTIYGTTGVSSRLWQPTAVTNDVSVSLAVRSNTPAPVLLLARGQNLNTASASYIAVSVAKGGAVTLRTATESLKTVTPSSLVALQWLRVTADFQGTQATVRIQRLDTMQYLSASGQWQTANTAAITHTIANAPGTGLVGLGRLPGDYGSAGVDDFSAAAIVPPPPVVVPPPPPPVVVPPPPVVIPPSAPTTEVRKYDHIRIAQLAYGGQQFTNVERMQFAESVDLVVANPTLLNTFEAASANTPKTIYSNVTNIYRDLLSDWLETADITGVSREAAFYHVSQATPFTGNSPSAAPVTWFWNASKISTSGAITSVRTEARGTQSTGVTFGSVGESIAFGSLEEFREINVTITKPAASGHWGVWEYASFADATGAPVNWKPLSVLSNTALGMKSSGRISFNPPSDWVTSRVGTSERLFYVRYRTTVGNASNAPIARSILGRDYVNANGATVGTIPAFDANADTNHDGYLTDAEYASRRNGADARFTYESRLFYPYYGQMRFVVNPNSDAVQEWMGDFHAAFLDEHPNADGLFLDNTSGKLPIAGTPVIESTANYTSDTADLVAAVKSAVNNRTVIVNTSGAGANAFADGVTEEAGIAFEEFLLRPTTANWATVNDIAAVVNRRLAASPTAQVILDSHPGNSSMTDTRTRMGVLSYYYLVGDPDRTYLMLFGGYSPNSSWTQRSIPATSVDVGQPQATMSVFASGLDPTNTNLEYRVYGRAYDNALVLYKPLSYKLGKGTGTLADATATTHALNGNYRVLNADGTRGPVISSITLRNGEGAVLMKA